MSKLLLIALVLMVSISLKAEGISEGKSFSGNQQLNDLDIVESDGEVDRLRQSARIARTPRAYEDAAPQAETVYQSGALSLQALNPEISVVGDFISWAGETEGEPKSSYSDLRVAGVHFESYLDPYSKLKVVVPVTRTGAALGEGYYTRYSFIKNVNLTLGKFHQEFGAINRWHDPSLDQIELPLAPRYIFGGHLNSAGLSLDWLAPQIYGGEQSLILQITNGENPVLFSTFYGGTTTNNNPKNAPSVLVRYKYYKDLSKDTYAELGLSALAGRNNMWKAGGFLISDKLWTTVYGVDFTVLWEPTHAMRYRNFIWRSEFYFLDKALQAPDGSGPDNIRAWGFYSYVQDKISRTTEIGLRYDYYRPDTKPYSISSIALTRHNPYQWQLSPYLTYWQSPWVKWRLEYDYRYGRGMPDDNRVMLQCTFAAGPHKHERY